MMVSRSWPLPTPFARHFHDAFVRSGSAVVWQAACFSPSLTGNLVVSLLDAQDLVQFRGHCSLVALDGKLEAHGVDQSFELLHVERVPPSIWLHQRVVVDVPSGIPQQSWSVPRASTTTGLIILASNKPLAMTATAFREPLINRLQCIVCCAIRIVRTTINRQPFNPPLHF